MNATTVACLVLLLATSPNTLAQTFWGQSATKAKDISPLLSSYLALHPSFPGVTAGGLSFVGGGPGRGGAT